VKQQYLPDKLRSKKYYKPKKSGKFEQALASVYENIEKKK
jgi:putative ATPase